MWRGFLSLLSLFSFNEGLVSDVKSLKSPKGKRMILIETPVVRTDAPFVCARYGGKLAKLEDEDEFQWLAYEINSTAWIESWQGKNYGGACIAFFTGGAVAVPLGSCNSKQMVLCDVAKIE